MALPTRYILKDISTGISSVPLAEVVYLQACGQYVTIYLACGKAITQCRRLAHHLARLRPSGLFCRIHRSYAINLQHFVSVAKDRTVTLTNHIQLRASKQYYPHLLAMLGGL